MIGNEVWREKKYQKKWGMNCTARCAEHCTFYFPLKDCKPVRHLEGNRQIRWVLMCVPCIRTVMLAAAGRSSYRRWITKGLNIYVLHCQTPPNSALSFREIYSIILWISATYIFLLRCLNSLPCSLHSFKHMPNLFLYKVRKIDQWGKQIHAPGEQNTWCVF